MLRVFDFFSICTGLFSFYSTLLKYVFLLHLLLRLLVVLVTKRDLLQVLAHVKYVNSSLVAGAGDPVRVLVKSNREDLRLVTSSTHFL